MFFFFSGCLIISLQAASQSRPQQGPNSLVSQAIKVLAHSLKQMGEKIDPNNYVRIMQEEEFRCTHMYNRLPAYNKLILNSFAWEQPPHLFSIIYPSRKKTSITDLIFPSSTELHVTNKSQELCTINIESDNVKISTINLKNNGRSLTQSTDGRFVAVLMHGRKIIIRDKETNFCKRFISPTLEGRTQTSIKKIMFNKDSNDLIGIIHGTPTIFFWDIEDLFTDEPTPLIHPYGPQNNVYYNNIRAFCHTDNQVIIRSGNTEYKICHPAQPKQSVFTPDYTHLAVGMEDGTIVIWKQRDSLYYLLQCAVSKTLQSRNPQDFITLAETLQNEQNGPFAQLSLAGKNDIIARLQCSLDNLSNCNQPDAQQAPETRKRMISSHESNREREQNQRQRTV